MNQNPESNEQLREMVQGSRRNMESLVAHIWGRPELRDVIHRLVNAEDMLLEFSQLAIDDPDLMRQVLAGAIAALTNTQCVATINVELKRRASAAN